MEFGNEGVVNLPVIFFHFRVVFDTSAVEETASQKL